MESSIEKKNQAARLLLNKAHGSNNRVYLALGSLKKSWGGYAPELSRQIDLV